MTPLRAAARQLRFAPPSRGVATVMPRRLLTKTASRPLPVASTPPATPAAKPPTPTPTPTPAPTRTPVPAVSGSPLPDAPASGSGNGNSNGDVIDWSQSYHGLGTSAFPPEVAAILQAPINPDDIEVKPDGIIYLPEIKYRRILNAAFGPGGWGLAPRGDLIVKERLVAREYALIVHGRFVGQARGEQQYFNEDGIPTAAEGCKSNALMRCCKDLGIASELWDPRFIRRFMKTHAVQQWAEHVTTKKKKQVWLRRDDELRYPYKKS
ncbi:mitochondrial genome maintenance MGM101-domain-containing protein [Biscogniauxia mediterranea]|nr:mitochondrial genome maintenance MGM101-domain-containing protein [Biscogniauxia mediterranea]